MRDAEFGERVERLAFGLLSEGVGPGDRVGNVEQIRSLRVGGCDGPFSFEPFAEELRTLRDPARSIRESMNFIRTRLVSLAA